MGYVAYVNVVVMYIYIYICSKHGLHAKWYEWHVHHRVHLSKKMSWKTHSKILTVKHNLNMLLFSTRRMGMVM